MSWKTPDWYKLKRNRARAVKGTHALLAEFGTIIPENVEIRVSDSTAMVRYLFDTRREPFVLDIAPSPITSCLRVMEEFAAR